MPAIPAPERQEDLEFEANLGSTVRPGPKAKTNEKVQQK